MTEETKQEKPAEEKPAEREFTPMEQKAMDMGWRPKEEWTGDEDTFVDAKEFVGRQGLFDKISDLKKNIDDQAKATRALLEHNANIEKQSYERALKQFRKEQIEARAEGNLERYDELQEQIDEAKEAAAQVKTKVPASQEVPQAVTDWMNRNTWYTRDSRLKTFADALGVEANQKGLSGQALLDYIEKETKKEFPHKFTNPNRTRESAVEGGGSGKSGGGRERGSDYKLNEQETRIMNNLVAQKVMSKDEYIKQLKQAKGEE